MSENGQTHFKNLAAKTAGFLKCLTLFGHYALKGQYSMTHPRIC